MLEVGRTYMDTSTYDDATENVKLHLRLHGNMSLYRG